MHIRQTDIHSLIYIHIIKVGSHIYINVRVEIHLKYKKINKKIRCCVNTSIFQYFFFFLFVLFSLITIGTTYKLFFYFFKFYVKIDQYERELQIIEILKVR